MKVNALTAQMYPKTSVQFGTQGQAAQYHSVTGQVSGFSQGSDCYGKENFWVTYSLEPNVAKKLGVPTQHQQRIDSISFNRLELGGEVPIRVKVAPRKIGGLISGQKDVYVDETKVFHRKPSTTHRFMPAYPINPTSSLSDERAASVKSPSLL